MRRFIQLLIVVLMLAGGLNAQSLSGISLSGLSLGGLSNNGANNNNQFDNKLTELKKTSPNSKVRVIIQGIDPAYLSPQAALMQATFLKKWKNFHGFTMEVRVMDLDKFAKWHLIFSVDAPVK